MTRGKGRKRCRPHQDPDSGRKEKSSRTERKPKAGKNKAKPEPVKTEANTTPKPKVTAEQKPTPEPQDKLVIALDFGTTFSGIAYSFKGQQDPKVVAITNWPGAEGQGVPKIPTVISYSNDGKSFKWGASVDQMQGDAVALKLLLDPTQAKPKYLQFANHKRVIKSLHKPPVEIVADFIGAIYKHALSEISKTVPKDYFESCVREFVVTVPAIWSDEAKDATEKAAQEAGMSPVTMIKEPEAAALYTMHSLNFALRVGDAFVLCDAGGGTVDLITYEVLKLEPALELKELVPGAGAMAGSLGLNQRFGDTVKTLVGLDKFVELRKTKGYRMAMETFDRDVKRRFNGDPQEEYLISFPMADLEDDEDENVRANCWAMKGNELNEIFEPLITDILRLIDDQVKSGESKLGEDGIKGIFLVGGFGSSELLKSRIHEKFNPGIKVIQPADAWAAVVKGAVFSKLPKTVTVMATLATKHYGVRIQTKYDPESDAGMQTLRGADGALLVEKVHWFIKIGQPIQRGQKIRLTVYRLVKKDCRSSDLRFTHTLVECSSTEPPAHYQDAGSDVRICCQLKSKFGASLYKANRDNGQDNGQPYRTIGFDLVIEMKSAVMKFSAEMDGQGFGSVEKSYE